MIKRRIYSEYGVRYFWLVDPDSRTLEALVLEAGRWVDAGSFDETASARISPFESVEIDMSRLFLPKSG